MFMFILCVEFYAAHMQMRFSHSYVQHVKG